MAFIVNQHDFEKAICDALGVDADKVHSVHIDIPAGGVVTATIQVYLEDAIALETIIKQARWETVDN